MACLTLLLARSSQIADVSNINNSLDLRVSQNFTYRFGGEVENIDRNHNHIGKHSRKRLGGAVRDFVYDLANENGNDVVQLYREMFPSRPVRNPRISTHIHQNLSEHESFSVPMLDTSCLDEDEFSLVVSWYGLIASLFF
ncbi:hypothetical protein AVEN_62718-1 [Araneus ventricosus]|uniref:Uncharacterized protein n=1 Tax=Araneus ventricosus TaxID=182803 RepID=A0A4Y2L063_ARAVE|nr:hypothetical protein AVEN_62718-1 [Araneus ventricosus]